MQHCSRGINELIVGHEGVLPKLQLDSLEFVVVTDRCGELGLGTSLTYHDMEEVYGWEETIRRLEASSC